MTAIARITEKENIDSFVSSSIFNWPTRAIPSAANRRSLPRINGKFAVYLHDDESIFTGIDLSFGGLMCSGSTLIWPGNYIDFDLVLSGEKNTIMVRGYVAELVTHHGQIAIRLRFDKITQAARKQIARWMARTQGV
ncbi:MAG: PilZ domain-containing protein [Deltaproteobacteria bacterium]|nr:PilZ domain-containing protein [Deltaproteobacteria bacterium]